MCKPPQILDIPDKDLQLTSCFYCDNPLPATTGEHIFNSCWGGSHKTKRLICDECNNQFSDIDSTFQIYTYTIMNANLFKGERHQQIPLIDDPNWDYKLDRGKPKLKKILIEENNQNNIQKKILFPSKTQTRKWLNSDETESVIGIKLSEKEQKKYLEQAKSEQKYISFSKQETINLNYQYRSTAHTVLKCLGFFMPECIKSNEMKEIKEFAAEGKGDWQYFAVDVKQYLSFDDLIAEQLGVYYNSVEIYWCSYLGMVVGVLNILNRIKRAIILSRKYSGTEKYLLVFEDTYSTKEKPNAIFQQIDFQYPNLLTIGVQHFANSDKTTQLFQQEIDELTGYYYPTDSIKANFTENIKNINCKNYKIFDEMIEEYKKAILENLRLIALFLKKDLNVDAIKSELNRKFAELPRNEEKEFVREEVLKIWKSLMNQFCSSQESK